MLSSVGISPDSVKLTVQVLMQDIRVHSVLAQSPSRVFKGQKNGRSLRSRNSNNSEPRTVAKVDAENNLIAIKGAIPGPKGGIVVIADAVKA